MRRREFLRVVGGTAITTTTAPRYLLAADQQLPSTIVSDGVLVEAASFDDFGGWKLDTQHYQQMGGCYLLAHGMGRPVANATTTTRLPAAGSWHVWVRTRDWCPGNWDSPGRFRVRVDGKTLKPDFGADRKEWHWQEGGRVDVSDPTKVGVELQDLTGFDGRCDAIFFARAEAPELPSNDLVALSNWKDRLRGRADQDVAERQFDLVVIGGGIAGCAAALAAKSRGLSVALIQDRPVFGGNASEEVRVHTLGIPGQGETLLRTIDTPHYPNGHADAIEAQQNREATLASSGVDLFPHHLAIGLERQDGLIASVEAREATSGRITRFKAPVFVDATGDGWLGHWAGAECRYGRESRDEFDEGWSSQGDLWSPTRPDGRVMGTSVLWNSRQTDRRVDFPEVPWAMPVAGRHAASAGEWHWEYSSPDLHQIDDAERMRDHLFRAIYGSFANAKKRPNNATRELAWVAFVAGRRESRRILGDYIYTMRDMTERRTFADAVVEEVRAIDAHYQRKQTGAKEDFLSEAIFRNTGGKYYVPFRCLYSKDIANLMMAGRCFSCSHIGLCGPRVMKTCGQMGIAVGYAAALCKQHTATPRIVGARHIGELRELIGYA